MFDSYCYSILLLHIQTNPAQKFDISIDQLQPN